jgi:hypothetical protein
MAGTVRDRISGEERNGNQSCSEPKGNAASGKFYTNENRNINRAWHCWEQQ